MLCSWKVQSGAMSVTCHRLVPLVIALMLIVAASSASHAQEKLAAIEPVRQAWPASTRIEHYRNTVRPLLAKYCYDCHGGEEKAGGLSLVQHGAAGAENFEALLADHELWHKVLRNVRGGVMPPPNAPRPTAEEVLTLSNWIKFGAFGIDPLDSDPGQVTIHRLNRAEYRNTVFELLGVKYNTDDEFPPDAGGMGLDNIADLLTMSPLLLEKYLNAAEAALDGAFPSESAQPFVAPGSMIRGNNNTTGERLSFNGSPEVTVTYRNISPGWFKIVMDVEVVGLEGSDAVVVSPAVVAPPAEGAAGEQPPPPPPPAAPRVVRLVAAVQSGTDPERVLLDQVFPAESKVYHFEFEENWSTEPHKFNFQASNPNAPAGGRRGGGGGGGGRGGPPAPQLKVNTLAIAPLQSPVTRRYFDSSAAPKNSDDLREFLRRGMTEFGLRVYRRPMEQAIIDRLVTEAHAAILKTGQFHQGLKPTLAKVMCAPRFLFRIDRNVENAQGRPWADVDEYTLASRLSYFLWSSMPDDELFSLAKAGQLRANLDAQIRRMLASENSSHLTENFSSQWLQTRNVMNWPVVEKAILQREGITPRTPLLTDNLRRAMVAETTMLFGRVVNEDRSVLEFIDADYAYLNEDLARHYEIPGVTGSEMRLVTLPENSPRGGALTTGSTLLVTSISNRTSPVKRGVFVLETFLDLRPHDPPPNVPQIEAVSEVFKDKEPTFREMLEFHRKDALCASCHNLMDPIGLGLDNFNALGAFRLKEFDQTLDVSGKLATGEEFNGARELKRILLTNRRLDYYRCLTGKLMTYALGRGLEYYDTESVDRIVNRLDSENGKFSVLLSGIIESAPFQKRRLSSPAKVGGQVLNSDRSR